MFPPKTKADVGMVQCVSEEHGKPPGGKTVGTRWRASPCKEEGQAVNAKPRSLTLSDFEDICTIPTSGNILRCLRSCYHPLFLHLHIVMQLWVCNNKLKGYYMRLNCMSIPAMHLLMYTSPSSMHTPICTWIKCWIRWEKAVKLYSNCRVWYTVMHAYVQVWSDIL